MGIVKDATDMLVRVELHSKPQTISVDRSRIAEIGTNGSSVSASSRAPMARDSADNNARVWPQRPAGGAAAHLDPSPRSDYGTRTPRFEDGRYGASAGTPRYEDPTKTPMYADAGNRTPMHRGAGSRTPAHHGGGAGGSRTPGYEAGNKTPAYAMAATPSHSAWDAEPEEEEEPGWDDERSRTAPRDQESDGNILRGGGRGFFHKDLPYSLGNCLNEMRWNEMRRVVENDRKIRVYLRSLE